MIDFIIGAIVFMVGTLLGAAISNIDRYKQ